LLGHLVSLEACGASHGKYSSATIVTPASEEANSKRGVGRFLPNHQAVAARSLLRSLLQSALGATADWALPMLPAWQNWAKAAKEKLEKLQVGKRQEIAA
jgi:hypothetical protein